MTTLPTGTDALITRALEEDLGAGDVTAEATVPADLPAQAHLVQKEAGVICGLDIVEEVFLRVGAEEMDRTVIEGHWHASVPRDIALIQGPARALLAGDRVALNFLGHLSGISTLTAQFVDAVAGTRAKILDTRKTTPGMRLLEKRAVSWGGGMNHRFGLYDAVLIKENHIAMAGGVGEAVQATRKASPDLQIEVEAEDLVEVRMAFEAEADRILLDNMETGQLAEAVAMRDAARPATELEASGGINLGNVKAVAETGVDFISIGALTHSAPSLDLSLLIDPL
ncbi:MAG: carboxylating nicotinate-nucleotide diphosphorylase [Solirubrobacterales bacterium]